MNAFDSPGVHVYPAADAARVLAVFEGTVRYADLDGLADRRSALRAIISQTDLPSYVRPNLDSIEEAWRDLSWLRGDRWLIVIAGCAAVRESAPETFAALVEIAHNAVAEHASNGRSLSVVFVLSSTGHDRSE